uniref:Radical SAM core domain-containing protein n=1 Tax=Panagrolaimus sp. JU765 TaxID=591449 RepID=A0AC34RRS4_9BILA
MKRLILVALDWTRPKDPPMSLGHASILANLLKNNIDVVEKSWSVNHENFQSSDVVDFVMKNATKNSHFGIGAYVWNELHVQKIIKALKASTFSGKIIIGGPQISYLKSNLEKYYPEANIFVRGYAENALTQYMLSSDSHPQIKGIHYANTPDMSQSAQADLDSLPSPILNELILPQNFIRWETQRGCPFKCSFCQHRESSLGGEALKRRNFGDSRIAAEIQWLSNNKIGDLAVLDPTFNSGPKHVEIINQLNEHGFSGKIALQIRPEMIKPDFMDAIIKLNQQAKVVLEFGLQTIHKNEMKLINRMNNLKKVEQAVADCKANNIEVELSIIYGLPTQTLDSFKQTVEYCIDLKPNVLHAFPLMLLRGTELYENKEKFGLVEGFETPQVTTIRQQDGIPHVIASPSFSTEDWRKMANIADQIEEMNETNAI